MPETKLKLWAVQAGAKGGIFIKEVFDFDRWIRMFDERETPPKFLSELPEEWREFDEYVLIRGEIVVPRPKEVVTKYELS